MSNLSELVRQRDELNRKIREAELAARQAWSDGLQLSHEVTAALKAAMAELPS